MKKLIIACLTFVFCHMQAHCWWETSHMAIAKIAQDRFNSRTNFHVNDLVSILSEHYPQYNDLLSISIWADDVKPGLFGEITKHHQRSAIDPDNILSAEELKMIDLENEKALKYGMEKCVATLKDKNKNNLERAVALALLVHLVGDAHMPLNCVNTYNSEFPNGDRAGKLFLLGGIFERNDNLHSLWDSCILDDYYEFSKPLTPRAKDTVQQYAFRVVSKYPESFFPESNDLDMGNWLEEGISVAKEHIYTIEPNQRPSEEYLNASREVAHQRLALSGYRLANLLNEIFSNY